MDSIQNQAKTAADRLAALTNPVIDAGHAEYDSARHTFYHGLDRRPALVARPVNATEVTEVISTARDTGLELAVRGGGHSAVGYGVWDDALVLDLQAMKRIEVDVKQRTAWAETGLNVAEYSTATGAHGLVTGFGDTGSVGIGGITLGGGVGLFHRSLGLTIDSVLAADVVTADGHLHRVDGDHHPDLFWAIRGGGGNFGVVTRFKYRLYPMGRIVGGMMAFHATAEVAAAVLAAAQSAPEDLSGLVTVMTIPPMPIVEPRYHGQVAVGLIMVHSGDIDAGKRVFDGFRAIAPPIIDQIEVMPYAAMVQGPQPPQPPFAADRTWFSDGIDAETMGGVIEGVARSTAPLRVVQIRPLGGAVARVANDATAFPHRDRKLMLVVGAGYTNPAERDRHVAWVDSMVDTIGRIDDAAYIGFLSDASPEQVRSSFPPATWDRLTTIKAQYDPGNVFHLNQNIPPAG